MTPLTLKRQHFARQPGYLSPEVISNGHWALRRSPKVLANASVLISPEVAEQALGCPMKESPLTLAGMCGSGTARWVSSSFLWDSGRYHLRLFSDGRGGWAGVREHYLRMVGLAHPGEEWYSDETGILPFRDGKTVGETNVVIMPASLTGMPPLPGARP